MEADVYQHLVPVAADAEPVAVEVLHLGIVDRHLDLLLLLTLLALRGGGRVRDRLVGHRKTPWEIEPIQERNGVPDSIAARLPRGSIKVNPQLPSPGSPSLPGISGVVASSPTPRLRPLSRRGASPLAAARGLPPAACRARGARSGRSARRDGSRADTRGRTRPPTVQRGRRRVRARPIRARRGASTASA